MHHAIHRVTSVAIVAPHTLLVFSDGTEQRLDFEPVLQGSLLARCGIFARSTLLPLAPEAGTLVWSTGADFDPSMLHDWPQVSDELAARAAL